MPIVVSMFTRSFPMFLSMSRYTSLLFSYPFLSMPVVALYVMNSMSVESSLPREFMEMHFRARSVICSFTLPDFLYGVLKVLYVSSHFGVLFV